MYLDYGTWDDYESVVSSHDLAGKVALVKSGQISLQHKVLPFYTVLMLVVLCFSCGLMQYTGETHVQTFIHNCS